MAEPILEAQKEEEAKQEAYLNMKVVDGELDIDTNLTFLGVIGLLSSAQANVVQQFEETIRSEKEKPEEE